MEIIKEVHYLLVKEMMLLLLIQLLKITLQNKLLYLLFGNLLNKIDIKGAGIYWEIGSNLTIKDSEFENNIAEIAGGAIFTDPVSDKWSSLFIKNCTFSKNQYTLTYGSTEQGCVDKSGTPIEAVQVYDAYSLLCPTKGGGALFLEVILTLNI